MNKEITEETKNKNNIDATKPVYCKNCGKAILNMNGTCKECGSTDLTNTRNINFRRCNICDFNITETKEHLCPNCGSYIKFLPRHLILPLAFIIFFANISSHKHAGWVLIALFTIIPTFILLLIDGFKSVNIRTKSGFNSQSSMQNKPQNISFEYSIHQNKPIENHNEVKSYNEIETYKKENQKEYISALKFNYFEETGEKVSFENQKHSIFTEEPDFDMHNEYHQLGNGCREYFLLNNKWCYFNYDDEYMQYKLELIEKKVFLYDCYIDKTTNITKKLIKYIKNNPQKICFYNADIKDQDKIFKTGGVIQCCNCEYSYFADNKKCPNCGISTKENLC